MGYLIEKPPVRYCLECGEPIAYGGRPDRKFCSCGCRNSYHNRGYREVRIIKHRITSALDKNHDVLSKLLRMGVTAISLPDLAQMGFNPEYITSFSKNGGRTECRCYDIKYFLTPTRIFSLVRTNIV